MTNKCFKTYSKTSHWAGRWHYQGPTFSKGLFYALTFDITLSKRHYMKQMVLALVCHVSITAFNATCYRYFTLGYMSSGSVEQINLTSAQASAITLILQRIWFFGGATNFYMYLVSIFSIGILLPSHSLGIRYQASKMPFEHDPTYAWPSCSLYMSQIEPAIVPLDFLLARCLWIRCVDAHVSSLCLPEGPNTLAVSNPCKSPIHTHLFSMLRPRRWIVRSIPRQRYQLRCRKQATLATHSDPVIVGGYGF